MSLSEHELPKTPKGTIYHRTTNGWGLSTNSYCDYGPFYLHHASLLRECARWLEVANGVQTGDKNEHQV